MTYFPFMKLRPVFNSIVLALGFIFVAFIASSQEHKPEILKGPSNWEFERFPLPPSFAPQITYKGFEELRFAPGMFKKDSADYFSYAFVAQLDTATYLGEKEIKNYLEYYFKGLCGSTARDRKLSIDTTQVSATVKGRKGGNLYSRLYDATVNLFGVFTDGAPVKLNMEILVSNSPKKEKTAAIFIASTQAKDKPIWKTLRGIRGKALESINR